MVCPNHWTSNVTRWRRAAAAGQNVSQPSPGPAAPGRRPTRPPAPCCLAPGDVIAFQNDPARPGVYSHIAIYLGGGQILAAPHTGDLVKIQPVTIPYWTGATTPSSPPDRN